MFYIKSGQVGTNMTALLSVNFKINVKTTAHERFFKLLFKKETTQKSIKQVKVFYKKQVFIYWFIWTQFLVIIRTGW